MIGISRTSPGVHPVSRSTGSLLVAVIAALAALPAAAPLAGGAEVNVYSARKEDLIKPLIDRFTAQTGVKVNLVTGKEDALLTRLQSEGLSSPADLLVTTDAGRLARAKALGVTQAVESPALEAAIPASYRDPDGHWFGLSLRARPILYVKGKVDPASLSTYEALADPKWKGHICVRSSDSIYNQSLVASLIAADGEAATEAWARGLVANLAKAPQGGDRDQIKAAAAGQCDIAIANTYYLAGMLDSADLADKAAAQQLGVFWPNQGGPEQDGRGVHVNVSGAVVTKAAKHKAEAVKLMEYMAAPEAQAWYAEANGEYPVVPGVPVRGTLAAWGTFKADTLNLSRLGDLNADAARLMDRAGWK
jgi:iron(III) transport system substrate-binding protein